jgi:hypothetical protein
MGASTARISGLAGDLPLFYDETNENGGQRITPQRSRGPKELDKETATMLERVSTSSWLSRQ